MEKSDHPGIHTQPILVITKGQADIYPSISKASEATGISRNRLQRALVSRDGRVCSTDPPVFVDIPLES